MEAMDKAGNFIGWLHVDGVNLSVSLVEHALSKVHFTAERSNYYKTLSSAEEAAKQLKEKVSSGVFLFVFKITECLMHFNASLNPYRILPWKGLDIFAYLMWRWGAEERGG